MIAVLPGSTFTFRPPPYILLSLSLSYPPPSSRVLFLAEPFPPSSLLSYPIRSTGIEEGKGEGEKVWIGLCVRGDAKVQKRRSRKSTERGERSETCRRIGAERRRVAADYRVRLSFNELANCSNCCSVPRCISPRVLPLERSVGWGEEGEGRGWNAFPPLPSCNFYDPRKAAIFIGFAFLLHSFASSRRH